MPASLYLYSKSSIQPNFKLTTKSYIHLSPFILANIILIPTVYAENLKENPKNSELFVKIQIAFYAIFYVVLFFYQVLSFRLLHKNKQLCLENYSNTGIRRYNYLKSLNFILTVLFLISMAKNIFVFNYEGPEAGYATNIINLSLLVLFCWIIYTGLRAPELFRGSDLILTSVKDMLTEASQKEDAVAKPQSSDSIDETNVEMIEQITNFMKDKQPYLYASLSLHELSLQAQISTRDLSLLIDHHLNKHFFDFGNEYRIEKTKELLTDPEKKEFTVLEILYEVGFNSKSSFNTAFKKHTGYTPAEYRRIDSLSAA